jgi:hypothetical protein
MEMFGPVLFEAVKGLGLAFLAVHRAMMGLAEAIYGFAYDITDNDGFAEMRDAASYAANTATAAQTHLAAMTWESATAIDELGTAALRAAGALNLPSGYKTAGNEYMAQDPGGMKTYGSMGWAQGDAPQWGPGDVPQWGPRG